MLPPPPPTMQSAGLTHDAARIAVPSASLFQAATPPVGLVDVQALLPAPVTQKPVVGQEILKKKLRKSTAAVVQSPATPVGFVVVMTSPLSLAIAQNVSLAHEIPWKIPAPTLGTSVQVPAVASVVHQMSCASLPATHSVVVGQLML